ncbi:MAG: trimethylamine corrinoid protein 2 [Clostridiales bacterium]|nr:trimethylamine corrinoid protein 2 [Clostridiales bacterium]
MLSKSNWEETKERWDSYWKRSVQGMPLMCIVAEKPGAVDPEVQAELKSKNMFDKYRDAKRIAARYRYWAETHEFLADSIPNVSVDFGPGSLAAYLGCDIEFQPGTVWFKPCVDEWNGFPELVFDQDNHWYKEHIQLFRDVKALAGDDYYICIPDLMENIDVLASLRGAQDTIFDLIDDPEEVDERIAQVQSLYYKYYDSFYDICARNENGVSSSCYTVFQIWGRGKTLKLQCDFSAMMSPKQFRRFIQPALIDQCKGADNVLYHLDGPDAIKHLPALMEVEGIDALQWTSGSYNPDGSNEKWFEIYDQAVKANKGLWVQVYDGKVDDWIRRLDVLIRRYGSNALFIYFPPMDMASADKLLSYANKNWQNVEGSFR